MNDEQENLKEDTLWSMVRQFYNRKMLSVIILAWVYFIIVLALAVLSGIRFSESEQTKDQIMYAAIFVCCVQLVSLIKVFAWQMIHRNGIKQEIKRLELRIAELNETVKNR
jgi:lysylphosphatidylglycerol synthetase-like protein (DUF2156 family)